MAHVSITLPDSFMAQLSTEADVRQTTVSTLIAECIKDHYSDPSKTAYEEQLRALRQTCDAVQLELLHVKEQNAQQAASHAAIVNGLQHELKVAKTRVLSLSNQVIKLKKERSPL